MHRALAIILLTILLLSGKANAVTDWKARYRTEQGKISSRAASAAKFYAKYGHLVTKYSGGMPIGFLCAIAQWESNGKMSSSGDISLGEVGIYQITDSAPKHFGVDPDVRRHAEGNIFLAGLEYNANANRLAKEYPNLISPGSKDQWMLARLSFAIGYGGTTKLIRLAGRRYGAVWDDIRRYVERTGGIQLGSQSPAKIWYRVHIIALQWEIGSRVADMSYGQPTRVPAYKRYRIPSRYGYLVDPWVKTGMLVASLSLGLWLID